MIPRRFLAPLVICGPVTAAVLATLLAAAFLAQQLADAVLARGLLIAAVAAAAVLLVNVLVIVTTLGIRAVEEEPVRAIADGQYFSNRRNAKAARDLERV